MFSAFFEVLKRLDFGIELVEVDGRRERFDGVFGVVFGFDGRRIVVVLLGSVDVIEAVG